MALAFHADRTLAFGAALVVCAALALAACDSGIGGDAFENAAPETELSVRADDLPGALNVGGDTLRLISTVQASWSGQDPDGFVTGYELRVYPEDAPLGAEEGWRVTQRTDSLVQLPIPFGAASADVVLEVRAVDDDQLKDPTPARTVFPVRNSAPTLRLVEAEAPADTTWPLFSFALNVADRDGDDNVLGVEVALNDSSSFVRLPADTRFFTLVAQSTAAGTTVANLFLGRGFSNAGLSVPGLVVGGDNVFYVRSIDQAGATSRIVRFPALDETDPDASPTFFVRPVTSTVLLVNDYRVSTLPNPEIDNVLGFHRQVLGNRLGASGYDEWDLSQTIQTSDGGLFSDALPTTQAPTLRQTLALWDRIYWVTNQATNTTLGNNLPRAAEVMDLFFSNGGRLFVQTPIKPPASSDEGEALANAAINTLPISEIVGEPAVFRIVGNRETTPLQAVPGTGTALPVLLTVGNQINVFPHVPGPSNVALLDVPFSAPGDPSYAGSRVAVSITADRRVGLWGMGVVTPAGAPYFRAPTADAGDDPLTYCVVENDPAAASLCDAFDLVLDGLDFPR